MASEKYSDHISRHVAVDCWLGILGDDPIKGHPGCKLCEEQIAQAKLGPDPNAERAYDAGRDTAHSGNLLTPAEYEEEP